MGIFDWLKNAGKKVLGFANTVRGGIKSGFDFVKKIPLVGTLVNKALDVPVLGGQSLNSIGNIADTALDVGNSLAGGDYRKAASRVAPAIGDALGRRYGAVGRGVARTINRRAGLGDNKFSNMPIRIRGGIDGESKRT